MFNQGKKIKVLDVITIPPSNAGNNGIVETARNGWIDHNLGEYFLDNFKRGLKSFKRNDKTVIEKLTEAASIGYENARQIVDIIINDDNCEGLHKLYLMDSIMKIVGGQYVDLFSNVIVNSFTQAFETGDQFYRSKMFTLRCTWNGVVNASKLQLLDTAINAIDKNWPVQFDEYKSVTDDNVVKSDLARQKSSESMEYISMDISMEDILADFDLTKGADIGGSSIKGTETGLLSQSSKSNLRLEPNISSSRKTNIQPNIPSNKENVADKKSSRKRKIPVTKSRKSIKVTSSGESLIPNIKSDSALRKTRNTQTITTNTVEKQPSKLIDNIKGKSIKKAQPKLKYEGFIIKKSKQDYGLSHMSKKNEAICEGSLIQDGTDGTPQHTLSQRILDLTKQDYGLSHMSKKNEAICEGSLIQDGATSNVTGQDYGSLATSKEGGNRTTYSLDDTSEPKSNNSSTLLNYTSDDTPPISIRKVREKRTNKNYVILHGYTNIQDAMKEIHDELIWSTHSSNEKYILFRCNRVKKNSTQCNSGLRLELHEHDAGVTLYISRNPHNCLDLNVATSKLTPEIKEIITSLYKRGFKRRMIEDELIRMGIPLPGQHVLKNFLAQLRKHDKVESTISVGELQQLLEQNIKIPDDPFKAFVLDFQIREEGNEIRFDFVVSSKKLLELGLRSEVFNADTTHKLIWQGYPVQITGHTDHNKKFHPSSVSVSTNEDEETYKFVFGSLKETTKIVFQKDWKPSIIMSDAAKAISNAFRKIFGEDIRELMCWFHAKVKMLDHIATLIPEQLHDEITEDIDSLQISQTPAMFDKAARLFIEKYEEHKKFIEYFEEQWLTQHRNWYEGACADLCIKAPSCNNGLEVFNRTVKDEKTLRRRFPIQQFVELLYTWIESWSKRYEAGSWVYYDEVNIDLDMETRGYQWIRLKKEIRKHPTLDFFMVPAGDRLTLHEWYDTLSWETFDEYRTNVVKGWSTLFVNDQNDWIKSTCNCPSFLKGYMCKHIYGIALCYKLVKPSFAAKSLPLGQKRGRGRPKHAQKALVKQ